MFNKPIDFSNCETDEEIQVTVEHWIDDLYEYIEAKEDIPLNESLAYMVISSAIGTSGTCWSLRNAIKHIKTHGTLQSVLQVISSFVLSNIIADYVFDGITSCRKTFTRLSNEINAYSYLTKEISEHFPDKAKNTSYYFSDGRLSVSFNKIKALEEE